MKRIIILLFLLPFFAKAQQPSKEAVAKEFIAAIKMNDQERFVKLFPEKKILREIFAAAMENDPSLAKDSAEALASISDMDAECREMFAQAMKKIKAKKIVPAQIVYVSSAFSIDNGEDQMPGVDMYKGQIMVTAAGKTYYIKVSGIVKYKNLYYGIELESAGAGTAPPKTKG